VGGCHPIGEEADWRNCGYFEADALEYPLIGRGNLNNAPCETTVQQEAMMIVIAAAFDVRRMAVPSTRSRTPMPRTDFDPVWRFGKIQFRKFAWPTPSV
jgi:hypothetical protein